MSHWWYYDSHPSSGIFDCGLLCAPQRLYQRWLNIDAFTLSRYMPLYCTKCYCLWKYCWFKLHLLRCFRLRKNILAQSILTHIKYGQVLFFFFFNWQGYRSKYTFIPSSSTCSLNIFILNELSTALNTCNVGSWTWSGYHSRMLLRV